MLLKETSQIIASNFNLLHFIANRDLPTTFSNILFKLAFPNMPN